MDAFWAPPPTARPPEVKRRHIVVSRRPPGLALEIETETSMSGLVAALMLGALSCQLNAADAGGAGRRLRAGLDGPVPAHERHRRGRHAQQLQAGDPPGGTGRHDRREPGGARPGLFAPRPDRATERRRAASRDRRRERSAGRALRPAAVRPGRRRAGRRGLPRGHGPAGLQDAAHARHRLPQLVPDLRGVPGPDPGLVAGPSRPRAHPDHAERQDRPGLDARRRCAAAVRRRGLGRAGRRASAPSSTRPS